MCNRQVGRQTAARTDDGGELAVAATETSGRGSSRPDGGFMTGTHRQTGDTVGRLRSSSHRPRRQVSSPDMLRRISTPVYKYIYVIHTDASQQLNLAFLHTATILFSGKINANLTKYASVRIREKKTGATISKDEYVGWLQPKND